MFAICITQSSALENCRHKMMRISCWNKYNQIHDLKLRRCNVETMQHGDIVTMQCKYEIIYTSVTLHDL